MFEATLRIDETTHTLEELRAAPLDAPASANARAALDFCRAWLAGDSSFLLHTSGSTGAPKPIELTRTQMAASARATLDAVGIEAGMRSLVCMPARYIAGCMMLARGLVGGLHMQVVEPAANPLARGDVLPFDFTALVPLQLEAILAGDRAGVALLDNAQAILIGGAPIAATLAARISTLRAPVYHTYGMTETVSHIALRRLNGAAADDAFRPLPGVTLGLDARGCLNIRAPMTNHELVQTNDVVTLHADGRFVWRGRLDNVINSGGVKVYVEAVEAAIERLLAEYDMALASQTRFFLAPLPDARLGEMVTLVLEGAPLPASEERGLLARLREELGAYETPRALRYAHPFALTPTGKIDRKATMARAGMI